MRLPFGSKPSSSPADPTQGGSRKNLRDHMSSMRDFSHTTPGSRLWLMTMVSVLLGVLVAGMLLPVVGGIGLVAKAGAQAFETLPGELIAPPMGQKSRLLAADGSLIATFYYDGSNRTVIPLSQVAPVMQNAVIAIEDSRFYDHGGIDLKGTLRAFVSTQSGEDVQGGSTLTQQYVKNTLILTALARGDKEAAEKAQIRKGRDGYARKLRELRYAGEVEKQKTKAQILEGYLNISYFGNGTYGIETAAQRYFSKSAKDLKLHEAAMFAGIVQNPAKYDPFRFPKYAKERRDIVLNRMAELGMISVDEARSAKAKDLELNRSSEQSGCESVDAGAFCDYIRRVVSDDPVFGKTPEERRNLLFDGGLTIKSTLDPRMQRAGQNAMSVKDPNLPADDRRNQVVYPSDKVIGSLVTVEPGTGNIKAMVNSRKFGQGDNETKINYAADKALGGSQGFQPGSTFKIFVAAAALNDGFGLRHNISSPYSISVSNMKRCPNFGPVEGYVPIGGYHPKNATESENGTYDMRKAFGMSINTYFIQLQNQLQGGICDVAKLTDAMNIKKAGDGQPLDQFSAFGIGFNSVSPVAMAAAYAGFAARGLFCNATAITEVLNREGVAIAIPDPDCRQVVSPDVADAVNNMAQESTKDYATGRGALLADGRPQAGKTGTHERETLWYIGYTPNLATAFGAFKPDAKTLAEKEIRTEQIGGISPISVWYGSTLGVPIWKRAMDEMLKGVPVAQFHPMDPKFEFGDKDPVRPIPPEETGQSGTSAPPAAPGDPAAPPAPGGTPPATAPPSTPTTPKPRVSTSASTSPRPSSTASTPAPTRTKSRKPRDPELPAPD